MSTILPKTMLLGNGTVLLQGVQSRRVCLHRDAGLTQDRKKALALGLGADPGVEVVDADVTKGAA